MWSIFQDLVKNHKEFGMAHVEELDIETDNGNFEPRQIRLTSTLCNRKVEKAKWIPSGDEDGVEFFYEGKPKRGVFKKVDNIMVS